MSTIDIPEYWTAKEALAMFEFVDEIRECIWHQYDMQILEAMREDRRTDTGLPEGSEDFDDEDIFSDTGDDWHFIDWLVGMRVPLHLHI